MCIECMGCYKFKIELNNDLINETLKFDVILTLHRVQGV